jgi:hypothetical protein
VQLLTVFGSMTAVVPLNPYYRIMPAVAERAALWNQLRQQIGLVDNI